MIRIVSSLLLFGFVTSASAAEIREWTQSDGIKVKGRLISADQEKVVLKNKAGVTATLDRIELSLADQRYIGEYSKGPALPDSKKKPVPAKDVKINKREFKKLKEKTSIPDLSINWTLTETPHFKFFSTGSMKITGTAETAERLWHELAWEHPSFARVFHGGKKLVILMPGETPEHKMIGDWYAKIMEKNKTRHIPQMQQRVSQRIANFKVSWPRTSSSSVRLPAKYANEQNVFRNCKVFKKRESRGQGELWDPFETHSIAGTLFGMLTRGAANYAEAGDLAFSNGHAFMKELDHAKRVGTMILDADAYEGEGVFSAGGFEGGQNWVKEIKKRINRREVKPNLEKMYRLKINAMKPADVVLTYALAKFMTSTTDKQAAYAKVAEFIQYSSNFPELNELAKIYGYADPEQMEKAWIDYMKSGDFRDPR